MSLNQNKLSPKRLEVVTSVGRHHGAISYRNNPKNEERREQNNIQQRARTTAAHEKRPQRTQQGRVRFGANVNSPAFVRSATSFRWCNKNTLRNTRYQQHRTRKRASVKNNLDFIGSAARNQKETETRQIFQKMKFPNGLCRRSTTSTGVPIILYHVWSVEADSCEASRLGIRATALLILLFSGKLAIIFVLQRYFVRRQSRVLLLLIRFRSNYTQATFTQ